MDRWWVGAAAALLVAAAAGFWFAGRSPVPPPAVVDRVGSDRTSSITVHVSGAVVAPGLIVVGSGARVADAIAAAGGALPEADLGSVNLAAGLADGLHVVVPSRAAGGEGAAATDGRVRVNTASVEDLQRLPGVGPVLALRIVEHRDRHGPFAVVEDLLDVPGIGEGKLAALREAVLLP
jgi:competence protein ComEA